VNSGFLEYADELDRTAASKRNSSRAYHGCLAHMRGRFMAEAAMLEGIASRIRGLYAESASQVQPAHEGEAHVLTEVAGSTGETSAADMERGVAQDPQVAAEQGAAVPAL
jgi:rubrerythrin